MGSRSIQRRAYKTGTEAMEIPELYVDLNFFVVRVVCGDHNMISLS